MTADVLPCGTCTEAASVADVIGNDESDNESAPLACSLNVDNPFLPSRDEGNSAKRRTLRLKTAAADPGSIGLVLMLAMALLLVGWVTR